MTTRLAAILLFGLLSVSPSKATTLGNITLDQAMEKASVVAHFQVIEAKLLEIHKTSNSELHIPSCGVNVKARVITSYKSLNSEIVEFTYAGEVSVGSEFLGFLYEPNTERWHAENWYSHIANQEITKDELSCLSKSHHLKSTGFPQRLIPVNYEGALKIELNNIAFPQEFLLETDSPRSVIEQYTDKLVSFKMVHEYLLQWKAANDSNK